MDFDDPEMKWNSTEKEVSQVVNYASPDGETRLFNLAEATTDLSRSANYQEWGHKRPQDEFYDVYLSGLNYEEYYYFFVVSPPLPYALVISGLLLIPSVMYLLKPVLKEVFSEEKKTKKTKNKTKNKK